MIHQGNDHSVTAPGIVTLPQFRGFWTAPIATLLVSCKNYGNPFPEKVRNGSYHFCYLLLGAIVCRVDPPGHRLGKVGITLTKIRGILLFGIEGVPFGREIFPFPVFRD